MLDTPREAELDDIRRLASEVCGAPVTVVNLIDADRQWFKAEVGLGIRETPLATSICAHVTLEEDFFEIADTIGDPRLSDNPLCVGEPGLQFYAALKEAETRVARIAMLHEHLFRASWARAVDFAAYPGQIGAMLEDAAPEVVEILIEAPPFIGDAGRAAQVGVIVTEFVLNSIKPALRAICGSSMTARASTSSLACRVDEAPALDAS